MKMKDKKAIQIEKRKRHLEQLRETKRKKRRTEPNVNRSEPKKKTEKYLLICEGKNTEVDYFNLFKLSNASIKTIGTGRQGLSIVDKALLLVLKEAQKGNFYNHVWCIYDKDNCEKGDFNNSVYKAEGTLFKNTPYFKLYNDEGLECTFNVAYSIQAFEYWLILHFENHQGGAMDRLEYNQTINTYLKDFSVSYDGKNTKSVSQEFYEILQAIPDGKNKKREQIAYERAKRLYNSKKDVPPADQESVTTVFRLINKLKNIEESL